MLGSFPPAARRALLIALFYGGSSVALSTLNKALLSSYAFSGFFLLMCTQSLVSFVVCSLLKRLRGNPLGIPTIDAQLLQAAAPMSALMIANVVMGLIGLQLVNVPMFFCLRRLVAPTVMLYELVFNGKRPPSDTQLAVSLIVVGSVLAGWESLRVDFVGYAITMGNNLLSAVASIKQKEFEGSRKISTFGIVYVNSIITGPVTLLLSVLTGELAALGGFEHVGSFSFWAGFVVSAFMGLMLTYASILSTTQNSPLATSVTGNAKDVLTTALGWVLFPGFTPTAMSVSGLGVSFAGAFSFSYFNLQRARDAAKRANAATSSSPAGQLQDGGQSSSMSAPGSLQAVLVVDEPKHAARQL